jgi:hypothetical protein
LSVTKGPRGSMRTCLKFPEPTIKESKKVPILEIHEANGFLTKIEGEILRLGRQDYELKYIAFFLRFSRNF